MLQEQRSAAGSARWWDCRYGIYHKLGQRFLEELSPTPSNRTRWTRRRRDRSQNTTTDGDNDTRAHPSAPLPSCACSAHKVGHVWENRARWHLGDREEKPVGFQMSDGHAGDREGTAKRE